jgi:hypothetical protein
MMRGVAHPQATRAGAPNRNSPATSWRRSNGQRKERTELDRLAVARVAKVALIEARSAQSSYDTTPRLDGLLSWIDVTQNFPSYF